jgi:hypothetical protein
VSCPASGFDIDSVEASVSVTIVLVNSREIKKCKAVVDNRWSASQYVSRTSFTQKTLKALIFTTRSDINVLVAKKQCG